ncbi:ribonuclease P protein subunit p40-like isoform X2 [Wyeomyia smithii]|uniref:ribonuclease P protein subunit p40-like isoform X2 n=1 Tax=Wyeomyia smithii TaxID=174621 RepID=UPI0024681156|nr:ribonuclease P protein subunit p40-like isoform X2 [Wyeomyia smithii]
MLCPEVWRFQAPAHEIIQKTGNVDLSKQRCDALEKGIQSHHFNQMITIILPDVSNIPVSLETVLADSDHYLVRNLPLQTLVARSFIEAFVKRGSFYAVSFQTQLDTDDCVAVTPTGILILHLNKETYQSLGLEGKISQYARKRNSKYVVQINLKTLRTDTKHYNRIRECLGRESLGRFSLQITWTPPNSDNICPSSVAKHFADLGTQDDYSDVTVELMPTLVKTHLEYGLKIPSFSLNENMDQELCSTGELIEYMGMLALSCDTEGDEYLNSYDFCGQRVEVGNAKVLHWKGFFTTAHVRSIFRQIIATLLAESHVPWMGMYVHGFSHSPISFGMREHYFHTNGDNSYTIVVNPKGEYLWYQLVDNSKLPK